MNKLIVILSVCITANIFSQTNISPQFSELKGMEDQQGNSHLFYRIYSETYDANTHSYNNDIYHLVIGLSIDSLFLRDYLYSSPVMESARFIYDYEFWDNNFNEYIFCGMIGFGPEPFAFIERFDGNTNYYEWGEVDDIDISKQNDSILFAGGNIFSVQDRTVKSSDGGWNWLPVNTVKFISLTPFDQNTLFAVDDAGNLFKSTNGGADFFIVDTTGNITSNKFFYDVDETHIYRLTSENNINFLIVSDNQGSAYSWQLKYSSDSKIFICVDGSNTGGLYLADQKDIYLSTDYGDNFNLYKTLDKRIVGIYKKPNSDKLYAATKYRIYEITPNTIQVIKSLPIPDEVFDYYPLAIGNRWVYEENTIYYDTIPHGDYNILIKEVLRDTIAPNNKKYYVIKDETIWGVDEVLERIDSTEGKVYRYDENSSLPDNEYVIDDLLAEKGDTVQSYRMGYYEGSFTRVLDEVTFEKWGLTKPKKVYEQYILHPPVYSLTQGIGLDSIYKYFDFGDTWIVLKGCIINGTVYGDTTVVSVEDETPNLPTEFYLSQNYPNPFNPSTKIKFTIPNVGRRGSSTYNVTLKVYDVLGKEVATLVNEELPPGEYEIEFDATGLPSGVYFYQLKAGNFIQTKKMILLR